MVCLIKISSKCLKRNCKIYHFIIKARKFITLIDFPDFSNFHFISVHVYDNITLLNLRIGSSTIMKQL